MGTSLSGLTPKNTYQSLLKTTDNTIINSTLKTISDGSGNDTALQLSTLRVGVNADSSVTTQTSSVIQATTTNANLVLAPNGTGAIVASIPDGTATGGNARGQYAVDLQRVRSANTKITADYASYSTILNGQSNFVGQIYGTILGGNTNTVSFNSTGYSTVINGSNCTTSGNYSLAFGASAVSGDYAVALGYGVNASGQFAFATGQGNTASGNSSSAICYQNQSTNSNTFSYGARGISYLNTQATHGSNVSWSNPYYGLAQTSVVVPAREASLTTGATTVLSLDGTGVTNLIIPNGNNRAWNVVVDTIAVVTTITGTANGVTVGDSFMVSNRLLFKKIGGTSSVVGVSINDTIYDTSMSACSMTFSAGASQELALTFKAPTFTGGGSVTCRVVSKVSLVEVAY